MSLISPVVVAEQDTMDDSISDISIPPISIDAADFSESSYSHIFGDDSSDPLYRGANITTFQATTILMSWLPSRHSIACFKYCIFTFFLKETISQGLMLMRMKLESISYTR